MRENQQISMKQNFRSLKTLEEKYDCHCSEHLITQPQLPSAEAVVPSKKSHCSRKPLPQSYSLIIPNYCMQSWALKVAHHALMKNT